MSFPDRPPASGHARPWSLPEAPLRQLAGGPAIQTVRMGAQPLFLAAWTWPAARLQEPPAPRGALRLLTALLRHGTDRHSSEQIAHILDDRGARLRVSASTDSITVSVAGLSEHLPALLDLLDEVALQPAFAESHLERERSAALDLLHNEQSDPDHLANLWLCALVYGGHPYGQPSASAEGLAATTQADLRALHARITAPARGHLLVVGDIEAEPLLDQLCARHADRVGGGPLLALPGLPQPRPRRVVGVTRPGSEQTTIARGQLAIPRAHPDLHALRLANHALGGSSSGRLFTRLREELGLTYGVSSSVDAGLVGGDFSLSFTTAAARTAEACQALSASLGDFSTRPPAGEELERARRSMIGGYVHGTVGVAAVAGLLARGRVLGIDRADLAERPARIAALDDEAVQQAAARWITPADQSLVLVGVAEALDAALADEPDALRVDAEDTAYHRGDLIP